MSTTVDILDELRAFRAEYNSHKLDTRDRLMRIETVIEDVPKRVSVLEQFKWKLVGGVTVISALISGVVAYMVRHG